MKVFIGYAPTESKKGIALLSQNRQFQWFSNASYLFPVVLASAATMLKNKKHEVYWIDCIAEQLSRGRNKREISSGKYKAYERQDLHAHL